MTTAKTLTDYRAALDRANARHPAHGSTLSYR